MIVVYQPLFTIGLLNWLERKGSNFHKFAKIKFNTKCLHVDPISGDVYSENKDGVVSKENFDLIIGADGARSIARQAVISDASSVCYKGEYYGWKWKFLSIKPDFEEGPHSAQNKSVFFDLGNGNGGGWWYIHPYKRIHIATVFSSKTSVDPDNPVGLETDSAVQKFLRDVMGDVCINSSLADAAKTYLSTRASSFFAFKMNKYHHSGGKVVLVGDAAHTMSSHFGQGMTCGISDVCCLYECLKRHNWSDVPRALMEYSEERVPQGNAITDLNYIGVTLIKNSMKFTIFEKIQKLFFGRPTLLEIINSGDYKSGVKR